MKSFQEASVLSSIKLPRQPRPRRVRACRDLGLVCPNQTETLADSQEMRHCDVRYVVFYGTIIKAAVRLDSFVLTTGAEFFSFFKQFGGKVRNSKLQIPLPRNFFD